MSSMNEEVKSINCIGCGRMVSVPVGFLTRDQEQKFKCENCSQLVLENQVAGRHADADGKKGLLIEG